MPAANVDPSKFASSSGTNEPTQIYVNPQTGQQYTYKPAYTRTGIDPTTGAMQTSEIPAGWTTQATRPDGTTQEVATSAPPSTAVRANLDADGNVTGLASGPNGQPLVYGTPGTLGFGFGTSPEQIAGNIWSDADRNKASITEATTNAVNSLTNTADQTYKAGSDILNTAYGTAADQRAQGAAGLQTATDLANYNLGLGADAVTKFDGLGAQANATSDYYKDQGTQLLNTQQNLQGAGTAAVDKMLGDANADTNALRALSGYATGAAGAADAKGDYYAGNAANQGLQAQGDLYGLGGQANSAANYYGEVGQTHDLQGNDDRSRSLSALDSLRTFYTQGPGPSAAQEMLRLAGDQTQAGAISLANSGRGAGDNATALRQAMFSNAATQQTTNLQLAQLRAEEEAKWRTTQAGAMATEQNALGTLRAGDLTAANSAYGASGQFAGIGKDYYTTGANIGQAGVKAAGDIGANFGNIAKGYTDVATTAATGAGTINYNADKAASDAYQGWGNQAMTGATAAGNLGVNYANNATDLYKTGATTQVNLNNTANTVLNNGQDYNASMNNAGNTATATGVNAYDDLVKEGNNVMGNATTVGLAGTKTNVAIDEAAQGKTNDLYQSGLRDGDGNPYPAGTVGGGGGGSSFGSDLIKGLTTVAPYVVAAGTMASDVTIKENIAPVDIDLRQAFGYEYNYKDTTRPGTAPGKHIGPMAQDLEKIPATRNTITNLAGKKAVDTGRLALVVASAVGAEQKRTDVITDRLAKLEALLGKK